MKKLSYSVLIVASLLGISSVFSQDNMVVSPKLSLDVAGNHKASAMGQSGSLGVDAGFSIGLEVARNAPEAFNFGFGLTYLLQREQEVSGSGKFSFLPFYVLGKVRLGAADHNIVPVLVVNAGYNVIFSGENAYKGPFALSGGLYLGGGVRMETSSVFFEGMYKMYNGSASYSTLKFDITYTTLSLSFGVLVH